MGVSRKHGLRYEIRSGLSEQAGGQLLSFPGSQENLLLTKPGHGLGAPFSHPSGIFAHQPNVPDRHEQRHSSEVLWCDGTNGTIAVDESEPDRMPVALERCLGPQMHRQV